MALIRVTVTEKSGPSHVVSNMEMPIVPFLDLILIDAYGKKTCVTKVSCLLSDFSKGQGLGYRERDPYGNAIQIECEPVK